MNNLISALKISSMTEILKMYFDAGINLGNAIDGGAGSGETSMQISKLIPDATVYAFEPFPGNHRFFKKTPKAVKLIKKALADTKRRSKFQVRSAVQGGVKGKDFDGYSSLGSLTSQDLGDRMMLSVNCVRADEELAGKSIGFVKLDLQGGETSALVGMEGIFKDIQLMFIEYTNQKHLLNFLEHSGFIIFDTEYCFLGEPTLIAKNLFDISEENGTLTSGEVYWKGWKKLPWNDFREEFARYKEDINLLQTDLVCVNKKYIGNFLKALQAIRC